MRPDVAGNDCERIGVFSSFGAFWRAGRLAAECFTWNTERAEARDGKTGQSDIVRTEKVLTKPGPVFCVTSTCARGGRNEKDPDALRGIQTAQCGGWTTRRVICGRQSGNPSATAMSAITCPDRRRRNSLYLSNITESAIVLVEELHKMTAQLSIRNPADGS